MTHKEAIALSAYTGYCFVPFDEVHKFIEEVLDRPVLAHELARKHMKKNLDAYIHIDD